MDTIVLSLLSFCICYLFIIYIIKFRRYRRIQSLDPAKDCEEIYHLLCCYEFPWECFYGINFAFYRTFSSPTISGLYHYTGTIENTTEKRVCDTDILMHAWIDYGIDSDQGKRSWQHLNRIHGSFTGTKNIDFVYVLCCFIVDTIRFIDIFGWRKLTDVEKQALFHFWIKLGSRMNLKDMPNTLQEASFLVEDYVNSNTLSRDTKAGRALTSAITNLLVKWYWYIPSYYVREGVPSLLEIIGGPVFVEKLGLKSRIIFTRIILAMATLRGIVVKMFFPPRIFAHRLSYNLMKKRYSKEDARTMNFEKVGPAQVLQQLRGQ